MGSIGTEVSARASRLDLMRGRDAMTLRCVAVPILGNEIGAELAQLFDLWADPRFRPLLTPQQERPRLLIVANSATPERLAEAERLFHARPVLHDCFSGITAHSAGLEGERDIYKRDAHGAAGRYGNRAGPNFLFQETMRLAAAFGGYVLQIELDCLPVQADWITAVEAVIAANAGAWVIGSVYAGRGVLDRAMSLHLNGNALYRAGDPAFMVFLDRIWLPRLLHHAARMPNLAYDCWWALERELVDVRAENDSWQLVRTHDCFFRNEPLVVNLVHDETGLSRTGLSDYATTFQRFADLGRMPVFFHGPAMRSMARQLLQHPDDDMLAAIHRADPAGAPPARMLRRAHVAETVGVANPESAGGLARRLAALLRSRHREDRRHGMALLAAHLLASRQDAAAAPPEALTDLLTECLSREAGPAEGKASDPYLTHLRHLRDFLER